jgi:hypothetical protein
LQLDGQALRLPEPVQPLPDRQLFYVPLNGNLGSPFGLRWGRFHEGIDIEGWAHTRVHAALSGTVSRVGWLRNEEGYGLVVKIKHERGIVTMYAHLAAVVRVAGDAIAVRGVVLAVASAARTPAREPLDGVPVRALAVDCGRSVRAVPARCPEAEAAKDVVVGAETAACVAVKLTP